MRIPDWQPTPRPSRPEGRLSGARSWLARHDPRERDEVGRLERRAERRGQQLPGESAADPAVGCAHGLRPVELVLVMSLQRRGRVRLSEVSQEAGIPPGSLTPIVDRLEAANLVRREGDRENPLIQATPAASALANAVEASLMRHLQPGRSDPSPEFAARVTRDLERIIHALDGSLPAAQPWSVGPATNGPGPANLVLHLLRPRHHTPSADSASR